MAHPHPQVKLYGLVRDKDGKPKFDGDPKDLHPEIKKLLTADEQREIGVN